MPFTLVSGSTCRLPVVPTPLVGTICTGSKCRKSIDAYGDHFFNSTCCSKIPFHHTIRDTLLSICKVAAPSAGFTNAVEDVYPELEGLLPQHSSKRPSDVGFPLLPSATHHTLPLPAKYLAIDVTNSIKEIIE